ncbi:PDDEXK-like uncharacterized protein DUF3799 [Propionicimonas paludicola]|uniref:PDDEXK-like uncharacterized protein DUF3799 n=1 Tax=Propionicimonas paludicola TaxID=185243 RepID=A0A2A9CPI8_9ACTN|nr:PD-(D/E)XK nuclease-like domain-containing protein [Propionicimonas paludicola]PFG16313.1 PDDEXK-like uncharacterized protein DUF3799 [Propionicimonas paludicola]
MTDPTTIAPAGPPTINAPGFYSGIPDELYHTGWIDVDGNVIKTWSRSQLKDWRSAPTPAHFLDPEPPRTRTQERKFDLGSAAHLLVLGKGPLLLDIGRDDWRSPKVNQAAEEFEARGGLALRSRDYRMVQDMAAATRHHPTAAEILSDGHAEVSGYWCDPETHLWLRIRPDWLTGDEVDDYKTAESAAADEFGKAVANYGYDMQTAMYLDVAQALGHPARRFRYIVQEKTAPFRVCVYELDPDAVELGRWKYRTALAELAAALDADDFPGYPEETVTLSLPYWAFPRDWRTSQAVDGADPETSTTGDVFAFLDSINQ